MKIGIYHKSGYWSERWIGYLSINKIEYDLIDPFILDISELKQYSHILFQWKHNVYQETHLAKNIIYLLELEGVKVFPSYKTCWFYDDKILQTYLLKSIAAPIIESHIFYSKSEAVSFLKTTDFPIVFKLKSGAGSVNVRLISNYNEGLLLCKKMFLSGFSRSNRKMEFKEFLKAQFQKNSISSFKLAFKSILKYFFFGNDENIAPREVGYFYSQRFLSGNDFDIRLVVFDTKIIGFKRMNRNNDFRASGSGLIDYDLRDVDLSILKSCFDIKDQLEAQVLAFDWIFEDNQARIVEISYAFKMGNVYDGCPGYWDRDFVWRYGGFCAQKEILENFLKVKLI